MSKRVFVRAVATMRYWLGAAVLGVLGCAGLERAEVSSFYPRGFDAFEFRAATNFFYGPEPDSWAEEVRLQWLANDIENYAMCPRGYEVTSRQAILRYESPLAYPVGDIEYRGRCKP
jgi:hypothetical protein